jgi:tetratricopeptide (TPR) repeat protein
MQFSVELSRSEGRLSLSAQHRLGPVLFTRLELRLPPLKDGSIQAGSRGLRNHYSELSTLELSVSARDLRTSLSRHLGLPVQLELEDDQVELMLSLPANPAPLALVSRWRLAADPEGRVSLLPQDELGLGFLEVPRSEALLGLLARPPFQAWLEVHPDLLTFKLPGPLLDEAFLAEGRRVPRCQLRPLAMAAQGNRLNLLFGTPRTLSSSQSPGSVVFPEAQAPRPIPSDLAEALAAKDHPELLRLLYSRRDAGALEDQRSRILLMELQLGRPGLHQDLERLARDCLEDSGTEATARTMLASLHLYRGELGGFADQSLELGRLLIAQRRRSAAAFLLAGAVTTLARLDRDLGASLGQSALDLLPRNPALLAARLEGTEALTIKDIQDSLPFVDPGSASPELVQRLAARMLSEGALDALLELFSALAPPALQVLELACQALLNAPAEGASVRLLRVVHETLKGLDWVDEGLAELLARALAPFQKRLEPDPTLLALLLPHLGKDLPALEELLGQALPTLRQREALALLTRVGRDLDPWPQSALHLLFRLRLAAGLDEEALVLASGLQPQVDSSTALCQAFQDRPEPWHLLPQLVLWLEACPDRDFGGRLSGAIGTRLMEAGRHQESLPYLLRAWEDQGPGSPWLELSVQAARASQKDGELIPLLLRELAAPTQAARTGRLLLTLARARLMAGQVDRAREDAQRAGRLLPMDAEIQGLLAHLAGLSLPQTPEHSAPPRPRAGGDTLAPGAPQLLAAYDDALTLADSGDLPGARALLLAILDDDPSFEAAAELLASLP